MDKKNKTMFLAILIVAMMVISGTLIYLQFSEKEEPKEETDEKKVIDDRINPYIYQGLTVELLRMRNRKIIDKMLTFGTSWKNPPEFYYIVEVDGEAGDASEVQAAGGVTGSGTFKEWDTFLKECRTNFKVPNDKEGQETSNVKITIMEIQRTGLLGKKEHHIEKLSVDLVFDYRTNSWIGDDYLGDEDGYGRILGDEYELRFNIYASDYDHDHVPYWTEVNILGTDPTLPDGFDDLDGDGIPTWWELKYGYDPLTWDNHALLDPDVDGMSNLDEYKLYKYGADPFHPDVFIEVDFMEKKNIFDFEHIIYKESQQMVIEKMSQYGISVYFDDGWPSGPSNGGGEYLEFVATIDEIVGGHMTRWYKHNFADERKGVFRYFIMAYNAGCITASEFNTYDHIIMDNSPQKVLTKRFAFTPRWQRVVMAKGTLHELGHTMGIVPALHYGVDNMPSGNYQWPESLTDEEWEKVNVQYKSIMNYNYIFNVLKDRNYYDFSDGSHGEYDYNDLANFYLPTFAMDAAILESPKIRYGTFEDFEWNDKNPDPVHSGWELDEELTEKYNSMLCDLRFDIDNAVGYNYRIYVKTDDTQKDRDARIYTKPEVGPPAIWSLIAETDLNKADSTLEFYCFDTIYQETLDMI